MFKPVAERLVRSHPVDCADFTWLSSHTSAHLAVCRCPKRV